MQQGKGEGDNEELKDAETAVSEAGKQGKSLTHKTNWEALA